MRPTTPRPPRGHPLPAAPGAEPNGPLPPYAFDGSWQPAPPAPRHEGGRGDAPTAAVRPARSARRCSPAPSTDAVAGVPAGCRSAAALMRSRAELGVDAPAAVEFPPAVGFPPLLVVPPVPPGLLIPPPHFGGPPGGEEGAAAAAYAPAHVHAHAHALPPPHAHVHMHPAAFGAVGHPPLPPPLLGAPPAYAPAAAAGPSSRPPAAASIPPPPPPPPGLPAGVADLLGAWYAAGVAAGRYGTAAGRGGGGGGGDAGECSCSHR